MELMLRRRELMAMQKSSELYPVGTNLYDGVLFEHGRIDRTTGEFTLGTSSDYATSDYLLVSTDYEYTRSFRLYFVFNYDEHYNYLGYQVGVNDLSTSVINAFIPGTKYIRTQVHSAYMNSTGLIGQQNCWLKRTA